MKYIDDDKKKLYWWNRNYFFAGTVIIILINIILFAVLGNDWTNEYFPSAGANWHSVLYFDDLIKLFMNCFEHANWQHVLLNMLCFFICGAWLERRKGTFGLILLVVVMASVTSAYVRANYGGINFHGYSGVNFGLYAYAIIDYCFMFLNGTRSKINVISGAVLMALIYFAACFDGGTEAVGFRWYPYDFMHNIGHYSSFIGGTIIGLTIQLVKVATLRETKG